MHSDKISQIAVFILLSMMLAACSSHTPQHAAPQHIDSETATKIASTAEKKREETQGKKVKHLPKQACDILSDAADKDVVKYDGTALIFSTPQEAWCDEKYANDRTSRYAPDQYPGLLPQGATARSLGGGSWVINY